MREGALAVHLTEAAEVRSTLDSRYDDVKNGRVELVDGEAFFENLRQREDVLLDRRSKK